MSRMSSTAFVLRLLASGALGAYIAWRLLRQRVSKRRRLANATLKAASVKGGEQPENEPTPTTASAQLDCRRKAQIVNGAPTDHAGEVCVVSARNFDMDKTIFHSLTGVGREVIKSGVAIELFWSDAAVMRIGAAFAEVPRAPSHNQALLDFMSNDCDFAMEHADGSFMDHLQFCYEYSVAHYKQESPRVLFLHSIMGVGTNFFPMDIGKVPKLRGLLTAKEYKHIECFPSFVRLLNHNALITELSANLELGRLDRLQGIKFFRVIDNAPLSLTAEELWVQLNYQTVHLLDFIPASNWGVLAGAPLFQVFIALHKLMVGAGKLDAHVDFDLSSCEESGTGLPITVGGLIGRAAPDSVKKTMAVKAIAKFSKAIGHSLSYELQWE